MADETLAWTSMLQESRDCVCFQLKRGMRAMTKAYDDALRPSGLRSTQFSMLGVVKAFGPLSSTRLGEAMVIDKTTLPRSLAVLARDGLVAIRQGEDRREKLISLTSKGEDKFRKAYPLWRAAQERVKKRLGRARIANLIRDLAEAAQAAEGEAGHVRSR